MENRYSWMVKRMEFDHCLGPYPLDQYGCWKQLSSYISKSTISRIEPIGAEISIAHESTLSDQEKNVKMEKWLAMQLECNNLLDCSSEKTEKRRCYFTTIPKVVKHRNITGEKLTALNLDKTKLLENILMDKLGGEEDLLLGELQFSFIAFMMGQSLEAFMQWKDLVCLFFNCTEAPLQTRSQLFTKFIIVIYFQLKHGFHKDQKKGNIVDQGVSVFLDDDWFFKDIFLYHLCKEFFPLVLDAQVIDGDLLSWARKLKELLETTFGWDFGEVSKDAMWEEDDEYAPVVVPLNEAAAMSDDGQTS
ncbi:hypothetical protein KSP39_PZI022480 [Platanthera zijinensis]|uniref:Protein AAR2 homolog n=1 Tax=Platanthera zijinensis TaxID=2320716 RepID=A0AAP0AV16_9ASPA